MIFILQMRKLRITLLINVQLFMLMHIVRTERP